MLAISRRKYGNTHPGKSHETFAVMELLELVENEPTARPFQCDWQACSKVSMPADGETMDGNADP